MGSENVSLTEAEWSIMECLWENSPQSGRELIDYLAEKNGWNRSTTLTLLRRLENKGAVSGGSETGIKMYKPLVARVDAALRETESLIDRIYKGSLSMMVSAFTEKQALSKEEIEQLYAILQQAEENNND